MILGINALRLVTQRSGVARAIEAILQHLETLEHPFTDIRVYTPRPLDGSTFLPRAARNVVLASPLPDGWWEQLVLPVGHAGRGVLLCPSYVQPMVTGCPTLLVHHGSYEGYPQAFPRLPLFKARLLYTLSCWRATAVTTVSEHSRRDMARFYRLPLDRIEVVPEGVDTTVFRPMRDEAAVGEWRQRVLGDDTPFLVYVGKPTERRNLSALIRAFSDLRRRHGLPHRFVIVGASLAGDSPYRAVISELDLEPHVTVLPHASHAEIALIYNAASCLVYPSSYEGFGMPVLEAMACGTPVIALDNTAFPEFAGGVAMLLPDARVATLAEAMYRVLTDSALRQQMAEAGPARAAAYDWKFVTQRYLEILVRLATRAA